MVGGAPLLGERESVCERERERARERDREREKESRAGGRTTLGWVSREWSFAPPAAAVTAAYLHLAFDVWGVGVSGRVSCVGCRVQGVGVQGVGCKV